MTLRWLAVALAALAAQSQPTFRSQVELIRLDVSVVDKAGQPVRDLRAEDFIVRVGGKPRTVSFARFYGPEAQQQAVPTADAPPPSFATNTAAVQGRVVVIVVDVESMKPGYEKLVLDTAGGLVDRLGPADSVGLVLIPGKGIELTRDHARVRDALQRLRGFASESLRERLITVREAEAFERHDSRIISEVIERECRMYETTCPRELETAAKQLLMEADRRTRDVVRTLSDLNANLVAIDAPRSILLLSAGLPFRQEHLSLFDDLKRRTAESGTTTYVVQLEQPDTDASTRRMAGVGSLGRSDLYEGLSHVAGATDATFRSGVGRALGVFDRIQSEIVHTYQLGVESVPADADGKAHKIEVEVRRPAVQVRARNEFVVPKEPRVARNPVSVLGLPVELAELPLSVAAYNTRGEEAATVKLLVVLESSSAKASTTLPTYAFTINSQDDRAVFQTDGTLNVNGDGARATVAAQIAPGRYRLRAAVVDADGRAGSVELPLAVGMRQSGTLQLSDLIVGTIGSGFAPSARIAAPAMIGLLEIYAADPAQFEGITMDLELRSAGADAVVASAPATIAKTSLERRRLAQGELDVASLAPGRYVVSAIVKRNGAPFARVNREFVRP